MSINHHLIVIHMTMRLKPQSLIHIVQLPSSTVCSLSLYLPPSILPFFLSLSLSLSPPAPSPFSINAGRDNAHQRWRNLCSVHWHWGTASQQTQEIPQVRISNVHQSVVHVVHETISQKEENYDIMLYHQPIPLISAAILPTVKSHRISKYM